MPAMPSPFPGMDPYLEGQRWGDFHSDFVPAIRRALVALLRPRYTAVVEVHVYLERQPAEDRRRRIRPDVAVAEERAVYPMAGESSVAVLEAPLSVPVLIHEEEVQLFVPLRHPEHGGLVTVIELLSPGN